MIREQQLEPIQFMAAVQVGNDLYFSAWHVNALFKREGNTGNIEFIGSVEQEEIDSRLHSHAFFYENQIYFIPDLGRYIAKLNLMDLSIETIEIPVSRCCSQKFVDIVCAREALWLIPTGYDALIRLDLKTDAIEKYADWPEGVEWIDEKKDLFCGAVYISDLLCLCPYESDYFVTFDIEKKEMKKWDWRYPTHAFYKIIYHKDDIWMLPEGEYPYIIKYSLETKNIKKIAIDEAITNGKSVLYATAAIIGDTIVLAPYYSNRWILLDANTDKMKKIEAKDSLYIGANYFKDGVIITEGWNKPVQFISGKTHEISEIPFMLSEEVKKEYLTHVMQRNGGSEAVLRERDFSLDMFMEGVLERKKICERNTDTHGGNIYKSITGTLG